MPLIPHPTGNYLFLPGIAPYSCGAVAAAGYEIVHATFQNPPPYQTGFRRLAEHLAAESRPRSALCGIELRCPRPYSFAGFGAFNGEYTQILQEWGLFVDGVNPVARTNVAPVVHPPAEPLLYGFSYTQPVSVPGTPTIVVAGGGELPEGVLHREGIIALGDTSPAGLSVKAKFVMDLMENRLLQLGGNWNIASNIDVYTVHPIDRLLPEILLGRVGTSSVHGVHWHYTRPPIEEIEFEMDLRCVRREVRL